MKQIRVLIIVLLAFVHISIAHAQESNNPAGALPKGIYDRLNQIGWFSIYDIDTQVNPAYQRGDFNGDGEIDLALQIISKSSGKRGIMVMHAGDTFLHMMGAGNAFSNLGDDFAWLKCWKVDPYTVKRSRYGSDVEALMINHPERTGLLIFWDGNAYIAHAMEPYYYYSDSADLTQPLDQDMAMLLN